MSIRLADTLEPGNGKIPVAFAKDIQMPDGTRLSDYEFSGNTDVPMFDLGGLGIAPIPFSGGSAAVETDTAEIVQAATAGVVRFSVPFSIGTIQTAALVTCTSCIVTAMSFLCSATIVTNAPFHVGIEIYSDGVRVTLIPMASLIDAYISEALGGDY